MSKSTIARAAGAVIALTALGRVFGFVRDQVIAAYFGTTGQTDAYLWALTIPNMLSGMIGGALGTPFLSVFVAHLAQGRRDEGWRVASSILNLIAGIAALVAAAGIILAPGLVGLMAPGFQGQTLTQAVISARIVAGVVALLPLGVTGLSWATLFGFAAPFLLQLPFIIRKGMRYEPAVRIGDPDVRKVGKLAVPLVVGALAGQIYVLVDRGLASKLAAGSIAALTFADKLRQLPVGLLVAAVTAVVYPHLAEMAARRDRRGLEETIAMALRMVAMIILPAAAGLAVLRVPIVALLFERGAFDRSSTEITSAALLYYSIGMLPVAAVPVMQTVFYSLQDTATPVVIGLVGAGFNIALDLLLVRGLGHVGIALANSATGIAVMGIMLAVLSRRVGRLGGVKILLSLGKIAAATFVMGLVAFISGREIGLYGTGLGLKAQLIRVAGTIGLAGVVYAICLFLFRVDEAAAGGRWVGRKLLRRYASGE